MIWVTTDLLRRRLEAARTWKADRLHGAGVWTFEVGGELTGLRLADDELRSRIQIGPDFDDAGAGQDDS
jgi:hypothetical protein